MTEASELPGEARVRGRVRIRAQWGTAAHATARADSQGDGPRWLRQGPGDSPPSASVGSGQVRPPRRTPPASGRWGKGKAVVTYLTEITYALQFAGWEPPPWAAQDVRRAGPGRASGVEAKDANKSPSNPARALRGGPWKEPPGTSSPAARCFPWAVVRRRGREQAPPDQARRRRRRAAGTPFFAGCRSAWRIMALRSAEAPSSQRSQSSKAIRGWSLAMSPTWLATLRRT